MRYPRRESGITLRRAQSAFGKRGVIITMNQVVYDARMVWVFLPQFLQNGSRLKLLGQSRVIGCGITNGQYCEGVEGLRFEIIRIFLMELAHRLFIGKYAIPRPDWPMA